MGAPKFFGQLVARHATPAGACAIVDHALARPLPAHDHRVAYFCLLARGGYAEVAGRRFDYHPGTVIFHPAALHHRDEITTGRTRLVVVDVEEAQLELLRDLRRTSVSRRPGEDVVRCEAPAGILMSALEAGLAARASAAADPASAHANVNDEELDAQIDELLIELLGVLASASAGTGGDAGSRSDDSRTPGPWLASALELMSDEMASPLRVTEIAARVGVHPVRLARAIRRRYRCSVSAHLHTVRIERACQLLRATNRPLIDIAADLGYADQSHFTRVFSARLRMSPSRYRAALR